MSRTFSLLALVVISASWLCIANAAETTGRKPPASQPASQPADKEVKLTGKFIWNAQKGQQHDLLAVMTPADKADEFTVVWTFKWSGKEQVWKGTFTGNPRKGAVSGTGQTPDGKRKFTFTGKSVGGVMTCLTFEIIKGKETATGDMMLKV